MSTETDINVSIHFLSQPFFCGFDMHDPKVNHFSMKMILLKSKQVLPNWLFQGMMATYQGKMATYSHIKCNAK